MQPNPSTVRLSFIVCLRPSELSFQRIDIASDAVRRALEIHPVTSLDTQRRRSMSVRSDLLMFAGQNRCSTLDWLGGLVVSIMRASLVAVLVRRRVVTLSVILGTVRRIL